MTKQQMYSFVEVSVSMRWQFMGSKTPAGMHEGLTAFPLQRLYEIQKQIEKRLDDLRKNEPSAKRWNETAHRVWFAQC